MGKFNLNYLRDLDVIEFNSGVRIGRIDDFVIDSEEQKIVAMLIPKSKGFLRSSEYLEIPWARIKKIGTDVIIVEGLEYVENTMS